MIAFCLDQPALAECICGAPLYNAWPILVGNRGVVHSANLFSEKTLTEKFWKAILLSSLPHEVIGIGVPKPQRRMPLNCGIFMRKISVHRYVDLGKTVERLTSSLGWYANLIQVDSIIGVMWSGLKTYPTEAIMPNYAQAPSKSKKLIKYVSLKSIFILLDNNKQIIAKDLTFTQAKPLSEHIPNSIIKFQAMVQAEVSL